MRDVERRARAKIWSLLKLREAGANKEQLLALYIARVRSTLEYGAQVFGALINASQSDVLEAVQLKSLQIVLGRFSKSYVENMGALGLEPLAVRRRGLTRKFAIFCFRSNEHRWWFSPYPPLPSNTRLAPPRFLVPRCKRERDAKRPVVVYSQLLNDISEEEWKQLKLPPPSSARPVPNVQLPGLLHPVLSHTGTVEELCDEFRPVELVSDGSRGKLARSEPPIRVGGGQVSVGIDQEIEPVCGQGVEPKQCHAECFASLGGEVVCLFGSDSGSVLVR